MDWGGLLRDSWRTARRTRALWGLGVISAVQGALYGLIIAGIVGPMTLLMQLLAAGTAKTIAGGDALVRYAPGAIDWFQRHEPTVLALAAVTVAVWAVFGVLDVAATGGLIGQVAQVTAGRQASAAEGFRQGFRIWWRTVGLLAIAALPALVFLGAFAATTLATVTAPLSAGAAPDASAINLGNSLVSGFSLIANLVAVPLGVLVQLGLRFGVVDRQEWRVALSSAWRLTRASFADILVGYLISVAVVLVAGLALAIAGGSAAVLAVAVVIGVESAGPSALGAAAFVGTALSLALALALFAFTATLIVWMSVYWTVLWQRLTAPPGDERQERQAPRAPFDSSPSGGVS